MITKSLKTIIVLITFFIATSANAANTYYVRTDGNDNCNGLTDAAGSSGNCAFRTIVKGVTTATTAGDIVDIRAGDYTAEGKITTAAAGNSGAWITIRGHVGETVTVTQVRIDDQYNKFQNLSLTNPGRSCDTSSPAISVAVPNAVASYLTVSGGNDLDGDPNTCVIGAALEGDITSVIEDCIFENYTFHIVFQMHRPALIQRNMIRNVDDVERVWDAKVADTSITDGTIIRGNEVSNMTHTGTYAAGNHVDIFQVLNKGGVSSADNWLIENNYFHDLSAQIGINESSGSADGWIFRNNVFANISEHMQLLTPNTVLYNNTFFQCTTNTNDPIDAGESGLIIKNNIIIGALSATTAGFVNIQAGTPTITNNYFGRPKDDSYGARDATEFNVMGGVAVGNINGGDPKFVAAYNDCVANICDFSLQSNSPLIGMGADLSGSFTTDKAGNTRTVPFDIGAYEYQSGAGNLSIGSGPAFTFTGPNITVN